MQLSRRARAPGAKKRSFIATGLEISRRETPLGLYKGLGAVMTGIVPKMAIRFSSFEAYKQLLANDKGHVSGQATFLGECVPVFRIVGFTLCWNFLFEELSNSVEPCRNQELDQLPKMNNAQDLALLLLKNSTNSALTAGLAAGVTEAVAVVTPMEVIKIRLQAQHHSMADPLDIPKYRNAAHALYTVVKEEGVGALYRGVSLTALRQGVFPIFSLKSTSQLAVPNPQVAPQHVFKTSSDKNLGSNQAVNFTAYTEFKELLQKWQPQYADSPIPSYQTTLIGLISGAMGPLSNAPIDTIKTRLQKMPALPGETALSRITAIARDMFK